MEQNSFVSISLVNSRLIGSIRVHKMVKTVTEDIGQAEQAIQGLWNTLTEDEEPDEF